MSCGVIFQTSDEAAACHYDLIQLVVLTDALTGDGADIQEGNHDGCNQDDIEYIQMNFADLRHKTADHPDKGTFQQGQGQNKRDAKCNASFVQVIYAPKHS